MLYSFVIYSFYLCQRSPVYNSDEEDSAESSSDEDIPLPDVHDGGSTEDGLVSNIANVYLQCTIQNILCNLDSNCLI